MAIYQPQILFSADDRELLQLLAELIDASDDQSRLGNYPHRHAVLSDDESYRLLELLESFVTSKKFVEGSYLIERLFGREAEQAKNLRVIYLKWKTRNGRSRAMATDQWQSFLERLGLQPLSGRAWHRSPVKPMTFNHFIRMEERLSKSADLSPRVRNIILSFVSKQETYIHEVRTRQTRLYEGQIASLPNYLLNSIARRDVSQSLADPIPTNKIVGVAVIVMDFAAVFTTRDWDVSGFISTIAGAAPTVMLDSNR